MNKPSDPATRRSKSKPAAKRATRVGKPSRPATPAKSSKLKQPAKSKADRPVKLLTGGNPQIAKADGDAPVQAYIAALSGWKREVVRWADALVAQHVPAVRKAVKWNSPFYGIDGRGWFLAIHVFTRHVKLTFFRGASLQPLPPVASKSPEVRSIDIREVDARDDAVMAGWLQQAAALPGWIP